MRHGYARTELCSSADIWNMDMVTDRYMHMDTLSWGFGLSLERLDLPLGRSCFGHDQVAVLLRPAQLAQRTCLYLPHALLGALKDAAHLLQGAPLAPLEPVAQADDLALLRPQHVEQRRMDLLSQQIVL